MKLNKYIKPPNLVAEKGEYVQDAEGKVMKVSPNMPTHDDTTLVGVNSDKKVNKGKGGIELENIVKVVSDTQSNRRQKDSTYTHVDDSIKFDRQEAIDFIKERFNLNSSIKQSLSPAKVIDKVLEAKEKFVKKFDLSANVPQNKFAENSLIANKAQMATLPSLEDVFETVFNAQEAKKAPVEGQENGLSSSDNRQTGGTAKSDNTKYASPLKAKFLLQQPRDLEQAKNVMNPKAEQQFRDKYGISSNQYRREYEPGYAAAQEKAGRLNPYSFKDNSTNASDYVAPNNQFMFGNLSGNSQANMTNQTNDFIAGELMGAFSISKARNPFSKYNVKPFNGLIKGKKPVGDNLVDVYDNFEEDLSTLINEKTARFPMSLVELNRIKAKHKSDFKNIVGNQYDDKDLGLFSKLREIESLETKNTLGSVTLADKIDRFVKKHNIKKDFTKKEELLIDSYTRGYDHKINKREHSSSLPTGHAFYEKEIIPEFEQSILKNKFQSPEPLYRGIRDYKMKKVYRNGDLLPLNSTEFSKLKLGDEWEPESFLSTTTNPNNTTIFGDLNFEIGAPKGQSFLFPNATNIKNFENESEIILPKNLRFKVESLEPKARHSIVNPYMAIPAAGLTTAAINQKQTGGGKTKLKSEPYMKGSRPALGTTSGKSIEVLDGRTISMDTIYDTDSVTVKGNEGKTFYSSKLNKYLKK